MSKLKCVNPQFSTNSNDCRTSDVKYIVHPIISMQFMDVSG